MPQFATGKHSRAVCDRCGFIRQYSEMREEYTKDGHYLNLWVCKECFDGPHPLDYLEDEFPIDDPQALEHPRPDVIEP